MEEVRLEAASRVRRLVWEMNQEAGRGVGRAQEAGMGEQAAGGESRRDRTGCWPPNQSTHPLAVLIPRLEGVTARAGSPGS